jgi:lysophospholipase L1-like esterase
MALSTGKRRIFGCAAVAMSLGLCLLLFELVLRLAWKPPAARSDQPFGPHPILVSAPLPGVSGRLANWEYEHSFTHNRQGLRATKEFTTGVPPGFKKRILFLGDSFTYGLGSENPETFVERIGAALPGVEVVNGGCNGYGQREELAVLDTLGAALRPDLVVLVFFWNDLEDNTKREKPAFDRDAAFRVVRKDLAPGVLSAYDPLEIRETAAVANAGKPFLYSENLVSEGMKGLRYRLFGIKDRSIGTAEEKARAWEVTARYLRMTKTRSDEMGSRLLVVSMPDHNHVDPSARIRGIEPLNFEIEEELARICGELGIECHDPTAVMREAHAASEAPLYFFADRHLTPEGNAAYAGAVLPWVKAALAE